MAASRKSAGKVRPTTRDVPDGAVVLARARDLCRAAVRAVARRQDADAVHAARQALKRARAFLRLLENAGASGAWRLRRRLAASARKLSPLRDTHVVARQAIRLEGKVDAAPARMLHRLASAKPARHEQAWWQEWCEHVAAAEGQIAGLKVAGFTAVEMVAALRSSAGRVGRRARRVTKDPTPERAHAWRKAVIMLREQFSLVRPAAGEIHRRLRRLSDRLGKAADATVLLDAVERQLPDTADADLVRPIRRKRKRAIERARRTWIKTRKALRTELEAAAEAVA